MLTALQARRVLNMSRREDSEAPMIFPAAFTMCLQGFLIVRGAASRTHSNTVGQDTFSGAVMEGDHDCGLSS